jgi:hypothetical protein
MDNASSGASKQVCLHRPKYLRPGAGDGVRLPYQMCAAGVNGAMLHVAANSITAIIIGKFFIDVIAESFGIGNHVRVQLGIGCGKIKREKLVV